MRLKSLATALGLAALLAIASPRVAAQQYTLDLAQLDLSRLDPSALLASAGDVLMRAPDAQIDALFQATRTAARKPDDARRLCTLFDPTADRSFAALAATANQLSPDSRRRFGGALADIAAAGLQSPRQPYDEGAARQTIKAAGVTAMFLNEDFSIGMTSSGSDQASSDARCRSFGWMLDALSGMPLSQRAQATRLMLDDGMAQLGARL